MAKCMLQMTKYVLRVFSFKRQMWGLLMLALIPFASCRRQATAEPPVVLSPEEQRLAAVSTIDSITLPALTDLTAIAGAECLDSITAAAWMLVDDATGAVISQHHAQEQRPIASLTKMMTCLLALEQGNMSDTVVVTPDVYVARNSRTRPGDSYVMRHMLDEMMLTSDNDAAYALAKHIAGDTLSFCRMMNEKAAYLGMDSTHFANPNGMPNDSNYSTASDMVRLVRYCLRDSTFATIVSTAEKDVPLADGRHMPCQNTNMLLTSYEGCIGVKTGFTRQAGHCLASAATRQGSTLVLVLLSSKSMASRFTESASLLDYGFNVLDSLRHTHSVPE